MKIHLLKELGGNEAYCGVKASNEYYDDDDNEHPEYENFGTYFGDADCKECLMKEKEERKEIL